MFVLFAESMIQVKPFLNAALTELVAGAEEGRAPLRMRSIHSIDCIWGNGRVDPAADADDRRIITSV